MVHEPSALLTAAFEVFKRDGYANTTLAEVAKQADRPVEEITAAYRDAAQLLAAVLKAHSPLADIRAALAAVKGDSAEDLIRDSTHRLVGVIQQHAAYF